MAQVIDSVLSTRAIEIRDEVAPLANTATRVGGLLQDLNDSKINVDKISTASSLGSSDTLLPSQKAVKSYVDNNLVGLVDDRGNYDASVNTFPSNGGSGGGGAIMKGDLWFISVAGTLGGQAVVVGSSIRALIDTPAQTTANWSILAAGLGYIPENEENKSTDATLSSNSDIKYPSEKAVKTYVDSKVVPSSGSEYTEIRSQIYQSGTTAPSFQNEWKNTITYLGMGGSDPLFRTVSFQRTGIGSYRVMFTSNIANPIQANAVEISFSDGKVRQGTFSTSTSGIFSTSYFEFYSYTTSGVLSDDIISFTNISIKIWA